MAGKANAVLHAFAFLEVAKNAMEVRTLLKTRSQQSIAILVGNKVYR